MKAIQTSYKGYRFRSRLEARWAIFFETLKIKFEYEPEGYDLGAGERYLPDFWLPDLHIFVEVKPEKPLRIENSKADRLARERMAVRPFVPTGNADLRVPHAQEYSAFYLGEIAKHLEKIATSAEKMDKTLEAIVDAMRCHGEPQE